MKDKETRITPKFAYLPVWIEFLYKTKGFLWLSSYEVKEELFEEEFNYIDVNGMGHYIPNHSENTVKLKVWKVVEKRKKF